MNILRTVEFVLICIGILYVFAISIQVNQMKRKIKNQTKKDRGTAEMSKIIQELTGKRCKVTYQEGLTSEVCTILEVDEEWMKTQYDSKKEKDCTRIIRIELIDHIEVLDK